MRLVENEKVELKEIYIPEIKKEVIAFANSFGGVVYIGVTDDGTTVGLEDVDETMLQLTNALRESIRPDITMCTHAAVIEMEGKDIIVLTISEGVRKPYYLRDKGMKPSGVYLRQGTSSVQASEDAIRDMIKLADGDSFEEMRALEQELHFDAIATEFRARNLAFEPQQQKNLGLLDVDNLYTNLALLVSEECKHSIKLAVFQGVDKSEFKDRKQFCGSIFTQLNEAYNAIDIYNGTKAQFDKLLRVDCRDYPEQAIREALLNAIVHRDYSFSGSISINIYQDRIEFISLGGLVAGLSIEAVLMGASQPRNEKLAALFYRMKLIESYGIGIGKIIGAYKDESVKPTFETAQGAFRVILPNMNVTTNVSIAQTVEVGKVHALVLDYLEKHIRITRQELETLLAIKTTRASIILKEMLALGYLEKVGNGKNISYIKKNT